RRRNLIKPTPSTRHFILRDKLIRSGHVRCVYSESEPSSLSEPPQSSAPISLPLQLRIDCPIIAASGRCQRRLAVTASEFGMMMLSLSVLLVSVHICGYLFEKM